MRIFETVEEAYHAIGAAALAFPKERAWNFVYGKYGLLTNMVSAEWGIEYDGTVDETGTAPPKELRDPSMDAAIYLRDDLLRTTGARIWGLTFTLYPTGKFKIEYDYNKPEGYEETGETIDAGAAIASLQNILAGGSDNKPK